MSAATDNRFVLLENGEEYFPAVFAAIDAAKHAVFVETFILFEDCVGERLQATLIDAARRGVSVDLTLDGYGSSELSQAYLERLTEAGVHVHLYDPRPKWLGLRTNLFRRLHRKIVAVDGRVALIGGINFGVDHLVTHGEDSKQDYAVRIEGPLAEDIYSFARQQAASFYKHQRRWWRYWKPWLRWRVASGRTARLVYRDNERHRDDIEREYRYAIRAAKREILIACAYFFPGYRLLKDLCDAARRGVNVRLILQGRPDMPQVMAWAEMLYPTLVKSGVDIYEYCARPLHAKIATVDDEWATIGSSNLDPLSLALNLEANVVIRNRTFVDNLKGKLRTLIDQHCGHVTGERLPRNGVWRRLSNWVTYHGTRHFPTLAGWLPAHMPRLDSLESRLPRLWPNRRFARPIGVRDAH